MNALSIDQQSPLSFFEQIRVKVYLSGPDRLQLLGLDRLPHDEARACIDYARRHKSAIISRLKQRPTACEVCPAAATWDYGLYASKGLLCFYTAWFLCRSGSPAPCESARMNCPLLTNKAGMKHK